MTIHYIKIKEEYSENVRSSYESIKNVDKFCDLYKNGRKNTQYSVFEILYRKSYLKFYFDIEKIPTTETNMIYEIRDALKKFILDTSGTVIGKDVITINKNSSMHPGLSYHLYFPEYKTKQTNIQNLILNFVDTDEGKKYRDYIDTSVYSNGRLFRLPYQKGISDKSKNKDNVHLPIGNSCYGDFVIQYVTNCKLFCKTYKITKNQKDSAKIISQKPTLATDGSDKLKIIPKKTEEIEEEKIGDLQEKALELLNFKDKLPQSAIDYLTGIAEETTSIKGKELITRNILISIENSL